MARTRGDAKKFRKWLKGIFSEKASSNRQVITVPRWTRDAHRKVHMQLADGLIRDTPVGNPDLWASPPPKGYSGGRAKGNWQSSIGEPAGGETGDKDASEMGAKRTPGGFMRVHGVQDLKMGDRSYITNNVPYIVRLNQSPQWSTQQTPHWFERNIQRVKAQFD